MCGGAWRATPPPAAGPRSAQPFTHDGGAGPGERVEPRVVRRQAVEGHRPPVRELLAVQDPFRQVQDEVFDQHVDRGEGNCVEVAFLTGGRVAVRDSKDAGDGPALVFTAAEWAAFAAGMADGEFTAS
jgi:hypothetical protein